MEVVKEKEAEEVAERELAEQKKVAAQKEKERLLVIEQDKIELQAAEKELKEAAEAAEAAEEAKTPAPTEAPTASPSIAPTATPTGMPTSLAPTDTPTVAPTPAPTTVGPTKSPSSVRLSLLYVGSLLIAATLRVLPLIPRTK